MPPALPPQSAHPPQRAGVSPGGGSAARSSVCNQLSRPRRASSGERASASRFRPQRLACSEGRGGPHPGSRSARLPAPGSPHGRLRWRQQVALRSVLFCRPFISLNPDSVWSSSLTVSVATRSKEGKKIASCSGPREQVVG